MEMVFVFEVEVASHAFVMSGGAHGQRRVSHVVVSEVDYGVMEAREVACQVAHEMAPFDGMPVACVRVV